MKSSVGKVGRWASVGVSVGVCVAGMLASAGLAQPGRAAAGKPPETTSINPEITRRGEGARRSALTALELKPFPAEAFGKLADWQHGPALAASDVKGKVVLIVNYASWLKNSATALASAKALAESYAKKDLIVLGVHDKEGWKDADKAKAAGDAKFLLAHDAKNEFRSALSAGQDPEIYLIDRAGQLRFAGITTGAMEDAVKKLTAEKAEDAAKINDTLASERERLDRERRRTNAASESIDMTRIPELPFTPPSPALFETADWPLPPMDDNQRREYEKDNTKLPSPRTATLPEEGWIPKMPFTTGRAALVLFFHPDDINPGRFTAAVNNLSAQQRASRDYVIALAVIDPALLSDSSNSQGKKYESDPEKITARLKDFSKIHKIDFPFLLDLDNTLFNAAKPDHITELLNGAVAVISSDGIMRWFGPGVEYPTAGAGALRRVLEVDPGIIARRDAERKWLEANKDKAADKK
jgi:thiol-disulfide isomerase/thioredoxin